MLFTFHLLSVALQQVWGVLEGIKDAELISVRLLCWCSGLSLSDQGLFSADILNVYYQKMYF